MNPVISVIIPVYNGEHRISNSLDSLLSQTYTNFEAIIIDDGSIDNTPSIVKNYSDKDLRFRYIYQENSGVAQARNRGIQEAKGTYISFLDSDDYYDSIFLEKMYSEISKSNSEVCYCGYNIVTPSKRTKRGSLFIRNNILINYILGKTNIHTNSWLIKKDWLIEKNIFFSKGVSWGEDFEFFCEVLACSERVCYIKEYLTNYTVDFFHNRLSSFSIDKIDKDYESIMRLVSNLKINTDEKIKSALIDHRLSALITYRLLDAFTHKIDKKLIIDYFNKYYKYIVVFSSNNGLRSMKLNLAKIRLLMKLKINI